MAARRQWSDLSQRTRRLLITAAVAETVLKGAALIDLKRRPASQIRGPKWLWAAVAAVVSSAGIVPISYFGVRAAATSIASRLIPSRVGKGWRARRPTFETGLLRSALGLCRNGRVRASAVTSGHRRCRGTAGRRLSRSCRWDDAGGRIRLWVLTLRPEIGDALPACP
jgi:hypothetical protein